MMKRIREVLDPVDPDVQNTRKRKRYYTLDEAEAIRFWVKNGPFGSDISLFQCFRQLTLETFGVGLSRCLPFIICNREIFNFMIQKIQLKRESRIILVWSDPDEAKASEKIGDFCKFTRRLYFGTEYEQLQLTNTNNMIGDSTEYPYLEKAVRLVLDMNFHSLEHLNIIGIDNMSLEKALYMAPILMKYKGIEIKNRTVTCSIIDVLVDTYSIIKYAKKVFLPRLGLDITISILCSAINFTGACSEIVLEKLLH